MKRDFRTSHVGRVTVLASAFALGTVGLLFLAGCASDPATLYENKCGSCHSLSTVDNASYSTAEEWKDVVDRMKDKTTTISDQDAATITDYLANR